MKEILSIDEKPISTDPLLGDALSRRIIDWFIRKLSLLLK